MKRTYIIRALTLLLCFVLLLTLTTLPAVAAEDSATSETVEDITATWSYNDTTGELTAYFPDTDTTLIYTGLTLPSRASYFPLRLYEYESMVDVDGAPYIIQAYSRQSSVVRLEPYNGGDAILFATAEGRDHALNFATLPTTSSLYLFDRVLNSVYYSYLSNDTLDRLSALPTEGQITRTLSELKNEYAYELLLRGGEGNMLTVTVGYIYEMEETLYYLDATSLSNACFDGEGGLNPMKTVTVTLTPLSEELSREIYEEIDQTTLYSPSVEYEDNVVDPTVQRILGVVLLYLSMIPAGLLLPILPFVAGLILPHIRAFGKKKRWYVLTATSGIWMILSVILLIVVTLAAIFA